MNSQKNLRKKIAFLLIISIMSVNFSFFAVPKKAEAIPVIDAPHIVKTVLVWIWDKKQEILKKFFAALVKRAARTLIQDITRSTVNWINGTGGNITGSGKPAFVTSPRKWMFGKGGVADRAVGDFINSDPVLDFLCQPFRLQMRLSLALNYSATLSERIGCTLSQVAQNINYGVNSGDYGVDVTINGNRYNVSAFRVNGGWKGWLERTMVPTNNPVGAYIASKAILDDKIENETQNAQFSINVGNGAMSFEMCRDAYKHENGSVTYSNEYAKGAGEKGRPQLPPFTDKITTEQQCQMRTPGTVIRDSLSTVIGSDIRSTENGTMIADGLDQIFSALVNKILNKVNSKLKNGVLGNNSSADNDYINTLNTATMDQLTDLNNQLYDLNNQQTYDTNFDWAGYQTGDITTDPITGFDIPQWQWTPESSSTVWIYPESEVSTSTGEIIVNHYYPYVFSTTSNAWIDNPLYQGDKMYGNSALDKAKQNSITLINSLSKSEFAYQNNYKIAQLILTEAKKVFATSSVCNINYNRSDYVLRSLLIRANVITNIDGANNSDRTVASIPWNLEVIKAALADSNAKLIILNKASIAVNAANSIQAITDGMIQVNSTSFNTDPQIKMLGNIKTWLSGVGIIYNSIMCPINLTKVLQINSATSTLGTVGNFTGNI